MPLCTLYLLRLEGSRPSGSIEQTKRVELFVHKIVQPNLPSSDALIAAAQVRGDVVRASVLDARILANSSLTDHTAIWDLLLLLRGANSLPAAVREQAVDVYTVPSGIPSKLLEAYPSKNERLRSSDLPPIAGPLLADMGGSLPPNSQHLEASISLIDFAKRLEADLGQTQQRRCVTMLNLMYFFDNKEAEESYHTYGQSFAPVAKKHGGDAKIVGRVVASKTAWNEMSLVHYPSIEHFLDMLLSTDYQAINNRYRLGVSGS